MPIASLPSRQTDGSGDIAATAWQSLLSAAAARPARAGTDPSSPAAAPADLLGLYRQLAECVATGAYVAAHLGQSLDGHIATENGASRYITGTADRAHNHRMRALFDAVVVGRGTVQHDDPRLTVRSVAGDNPVRVVVDPERSLGADYAIFDSAAAPTLLLCARDRLRGGDRHGLAEVVGVTRDGTGALSPSAIVGCLADRGLTALFIEGGGITVSRFLAAGLLDRLQVTVAPLILGRGRAGARIPAALEPADGMHLQARWYPLGDDVLCDCVIARG